VLVVVLVGALGLRLGLRCFKKTQVLLHLQQSEQ
jgi:hypothetical protein